MQNKDILLKSFLCNIFIKTISITLYCCIYSLYNNPWFLCTYYPLLLFIYCIFFLFHLFKPVQERKVSGVKFLVCATYLTNKTDSDYFF